jgi:hypothetical protein
VHQNDTLDHENIPLTGSYSVLICWLKQQKTATFACVVADQSYTLDYENISLFILFLFAG